MRRTTIWDSKNDVYGELVKMSKNYTVALYKKEAYIPEQHQTKTNYFVLFDVDRSRFGLRYIRKQTAEQRFAAECEKYKDLPKREYPLLEMYERGEQKCHTSR